MNEKTEEDNVERRRNNETMERFNQHHGAQKKEYQSEEVVCVHA
ncbi:unnamed protein product [Cylicostephanus goldi]|uniref:Uncharacterized protein n=1 Tax=Cylicostephanus goldi TaxID=71465 RepID=A0A3P6SPZ7_CYLGO|nr:unnamed protein product [Cylicostephanus goldi]